MAKDRHRNRIAHNRIDLTGKRFGKLGVIKDTGRKKSHRPIWECVCDCGKIVDISSKYLLNGDTKSCGCLVKSNAHNRDAVKEITKSFWTPIQKQAERRGIPFEINRDYVWEIYQKQEGRCCLTGVPIEFSTNIRDQRGTQTASLDRISNLMGYVEGNVQWVHKLVNIMKNAMNEEQFRLWCLFVVLKMKEDDNCDEQPIPTH